MTTIACNLREMAADSRVTWEGMGPDTYTSVKLYPAPKMGAVYGVTGSDCTGSIRAVEWLQSERIYETRPQPPEYDHSWEWKLLELSASGIAVYNEHLEREPVVDDVMAVGSGRKVALYCMRYLRMSPAEAVREACKVDHHSEVPVYVTTLVGMKVTRWVAPKRTKTKP